MTNTEQKDTRIYYVCLHSCHEDDYDYQTHHLYLKGFEAYNLMLNFINDVCTDDEVEATHQIALNGTNTYSHAMDLEAVKEDIKYQIEDNDIKQDLIKSDENLLNKWKNYLPKE